MHSGRYNNITKQLTALLRLCSYFVHRSKVRGDWGLKGPLAQKILIAIKIVNQLGFYESHICPLLIAIWKPWQQCEMTGWQTLVFGIFGRPRSISNYGHKIPISWSKVYRAKKKGSGDVNILFFQIFWRPLKRIYPCTIAALPATY